MVMNRNNIVNGIFFWDIEKSHAKHALRELHLALWRGIMPLCYAVVTH